jgi:anhydro-N-acetylmuramic acid kinase
MKAMLEELQPPVQIGMTDDYGIPSDYLEAMAFALLANEALHGKAANLPSVTGARRPVILGKIVPGDNFHSLLQMVRHTRGG